MKTKRCKVPSWPLCFGLYKGQMAFLNPSLWDGSFSTSGLVGLVQMVVWGRAACPDSCQFSYCCGMSLVSCGSSGATSPVSLMPALAAVLLVSNGRKRNSFW